MKGGAVEPNDCDARVVDMEDLKKARERRASSTRHGYEESRTKRDDRAEGRPKNQPVRRISRSPERRSSNGSLMLLFLLLALLTLAVVIGLNIFRITSFDVTGNDTISSESVVALSGISEGENIFKANLTQAKKYIESDPLLEVQSISRVFPDTIKIKIRQRIPHGVIAYLGSYVVIDDAGFVLDIRDSLPGGQYPLITGIEIEPAEKGKPLTGVDDRILKVLYGLLSALYANDAMSCVSEAAIAPDGDILLLTAEGLRIDLGNPTDLGRKAQWIACTVPELRSKGYTTGVLYITGVNSPVYSATGAGAGDAAETADTAGGDPTAAPEEEDSEDSEGEGEGETGPDNAA